MSKPKAPRRLPDNEAQAVGRMLRTSDRKLNLVAQSIRGKSASKALAELSFSPKRIAQSVKKILQSAVANAENNHNLDVDDLIVSEAYVGKNIMMKRQLLTLPSVCLKCKLPLSEKFLLLKKLLTNSPARSL